MSKVLMSLSLCLSSCSSPASHINSKEVLLQDARVCKQRHNKLEARRFPLASLSVLVIFSRCPEKITNSTISLQPFREQRPF